MSPRPGNDSVDQLLTNTGSHTDPCSTPQVMVLSWTSCCWSTTLSETVPFVYIIQPSPVCWDRYYGSVGYLFNNKMNNNHWSFPSYSAGHFIAEHYQACQEGFLLCKSMLTRFNQLLVIHMFENVCSVIFPRSWGEAAWPVVLQIFLLVLCEDRNYIWSLLALNSFSWLTFQSQFRVVLQ